MAPTTAPSMMPTIGTISDEVSWTRRRNRKKIRVPTKAATMAPIIRGISPAPGATIIMIIRPSPAHSVVPVVVGSTNRFCVSSCMTRPDIAIAAPASTSATVRGMRVMLNISQPASPPKMSNTPVNSESVSNTPTPRKPSNSFQSNRRPLSRTVTVGALIGETSVLRASGYPVVRLRAVATG